MCSHTFRKCNIFSEDDEDFANIYSSLTGKCHHLSLEDMDEAEASYIIKEDPNFGISMTFTSDEKC
jgi:hypothetical protein